MNENETKAALSMLVEAYPDQFKIASPSKDSPGTLKAWTRWLSDLPAKFVYQAIDKHICQSKWAPKVSEIRESVAHLQNPGLTLTGLEAWDLLKKAVIEFGVMRKTEALATLPATIAEVADKFGWRDLCLSESPDVLRSNFIRFYDGYSTAQQTRAQLPETLRKQLTATPQGNKALQPATVAPETFRLRALALQAAHS